jgi:hypothetical protein
MTLWDRLRRWWKPGEYDEEPTDGTGHPLTAEERREETPYSFQDELGKLGGTTPAENRSSRTQIGRNEKGRERSRLFCFRRDACAADADEHRGPPVPPDAVG